MFFFYTHMIGTSRKQSFSERRVWRGRRSGEKLCFLFP
jgi:hypothetical protein